MPAMNSELVFDLFSYARRGLGRRDRLSTTDVAQIARTVHHAPEVMVKVLSRGANDLGTVRRHLDYIGRKGEVDLETDDGEQRRGLGMGVDLLEDWDLGLEHDRPRSDLSATAGKLPPRLVHKLIFSMPPGTPPNKVLTATRNFMREEFALRHRYAMALHTDELHPHVHVVLKAVSEQGKRFHIRKATLREWREGFARHLRAVGVEANATSRQIRGESKPRKSEGIFRAGRRGESTHLRERSEAVAKQVAKGQLQIEAGRVTMVQTRKEALRAWQALGEALIQQGHRDLAEKVRQFAGQMPPLLSEREWTAVQITERTRDLRLHKNSTR
jgi:Relaxase/Mobilisation nuclease domain